MSGSAGERSSTLTLLCPWHASAQCSNILETCCGGRSPGSMWADTHLAAADRGLPMWAVQESAVACGPYDYSRSGNPTRAQLEAQMADLEVLRLAPCKLVYCRPEAALPTKGTTLGTALPGSHRLLAWQVARPVRHRLAQHQRGGHSCLAARGTRSLRHCRRPLDHHHEGRTPRHPQTPARTRRARRARSRSPPAWPR